MKSLNMRIIHTHDTEDNWNETKEFIPEPGELIVYDVDDNNSYERFKIGDGLTNVKELPFTTETIVKSLFNIENNVIFADAGRITEYKE